MRLVGGLALAFSRLIDNSVVVLENIFRHLEMGESPAVAAERGGQEPREQRDLRAMEEGRMDPSGMAETKTGRTIGAVMVVAQTRTSFAPMRGC